MKASKTQAETLVSLMKREQVVDDVAERTMTVLVREGWYSIDDDIITVEGMKAADIPTLERDVLVLQGDYTYDGGVLPKGTHVLVHWASTIARFDVIEGIINRKGESIPIRMYRPATAKFIKVTMPDLVAMDD